MGMKHWLLAVSITLIFVSAGCSDKAKELYETAQFEEVQSNHEHALQLYERILRDHASSEYAAKAKERLAALHAAD